MSAARDAVIACARSWVGVPYLHQGRTRHGCDCGGLIGAVAVETGALPAGWWAAVFDPLFAGYGRQPANGLMATICASFMQPAETPAPGDVLLMRFRREPQHLAILCGSSIVHALSVPGRVVEHVLGARWAGRVVQAYRMPGVPA